MFFRREGGLRLSEAGVAQSVERVLGKDEVSGSNPDTSSTKKQVTGNRRPETTEDARVAEQPVAHKRER